MENTRGPKEWLEEAIAADDDLAPWYTPDAAQLELRTEIDYHYSPDSDRSLAVDVVEQIRDDRAKKGCHFAIARAVEHEYVGRYDVDLYYAYTITYGQLRKALAVEN